MKFTQSSKLQSHHRQFVHACLTGEVAVEELTNSRQLSGQSSEREELLRQTHSSEQSRVARICVQQIKFALGFDVSQRLIVICVRLVQIAKGILFVAQSGIEDRDIARRNILAPSLFQSRTPQSEFPTPELVGSPAASRQYGV